MKTYLQIKNNLRQFLEPLYKYNHQTLESNMLEHLKTTKHYDNSIEYLLQNFKMPGILTEKPTNVIIAAHEIMPKIELLDKYTKEFNNQLLYFGSNVPAGMGDFNVSMFKQEKFVTIYHQIKYRISDSPHSLEKIYNIIKRYNITSDIEPESDITRKLCLDYSNVTNQKLAELYSNLLKKADLKELIDNDALLIYRNNMEFDEILDLLVGFELNPNVQPLLEHHLALVS